MYEILALAIVMVDCQPPNFLVIWYLELMEKVCPPDLIYIILLYGAWK